MFTALNATDLAAALGAQLKSEGVEASDEIVNNAVQKVLGGQSLEDFLGSHKIVAKLVEGAVELTLEPK
jgi:hypothetical protein